VLYREVAVSDAQALMRGDTSLLEPIISAARFLEEQGVCAIAGACGSFAYYQMDRGKRRKRSCVSIDHDSGSLYSTVAGLQQEALYCLRSRIYYERARF